MALEQGRLAEFHGKNLDEIGIDPDGLLFYYIFFNHLFIYHVFTNHYTL